MGKRIIISENLARISTNDSTDGKETKTDKAVGWKKALTLSVHKEAEASRFGKRREVSQLAT
jgi:hypothetical protein